MTRSNPALAGLLVILCAILASLAGCSERTVRGDVSSYRFAWWTGPTAVAACLGAVPLGLRLRKVNRRANGLLIAGPVLLVLLVPALWLDEVEVRPEGFRARQGLWVRPYRDDIRFDDYSHVHYARARKVRGSDTRHLRFTPKEITGGEVRAIPARTLLREAVPEILERASARGMDVSTDN